MEREILFRGKRIDNGEWIYGYYCKAEMHGHSGEEYFIIEYSCDGAQYRVSPFSVGQYSGMADCNGTRVFEGDVVSFRDEDGIKCEGVVVFNYFRFGIRENPINDCFPLENTEYNSVKIIGNIYKD